MKDFKKCSGEDGCGKMLSRDSFHRSRGKYLQVHCKVCRNKNRRNITKNRKVVYEKKVGIKKGVDICKSCKEVKEIRCFKKRKDRKIGYERVCKKCHNQKTKRYRRENLESYRARARIANAKRRQDPAVRKKENEASRTFFKNNPNYRIEYERNRRQSDTSYVIRMNIRKRVSQALKKYNKGVKASPINYLCCTVEELKVYLESKFYNNMDTGEVMSWKNYGFYGWHIDHVRPLASFDLTDIGQIKIACHYTNLQPLWAKENLVKSNKWEH